MMMLLAISVFAGGLGVAGYALAATVLPNLDRIADALAGRPQLEPASPLVMAERRMAVRRWAAESRAQRQPAWREAA